MADKSRIRRLDSWEKTLICTVRLGKLLNVLPYDINYSTKQLKPSNYRGLLSWYIRLFLYCLDVCYLISAAKHVTLSSVSKDEFVNFYVHLFTRFAAGITGILLAFDRDQLMLLLNLLLRQRRIFQSKTTFVSLINLLFIFIFWFELSQFRFLVQAFADSWTEYYQTIRGIIGILVQACYSSDSCATHRTPGFAFDKPTKLSILAVAFRQRGTV